MRRAALAALLLLPAAARAQTTRYKVSAPAPEACRPGLNGELPPACASFVRITVKTYLFDVVGYFRDFGGEIVLDRKRPRASRVEMKARTASVDTGIAFRDEHLREGDFFDCGAFPEAVFVSTGIAVIDARSFDLMGKLTIKKLALPQRFRVRALREWKDAAGKSHVLYSAATVIDRRTYGLDWNEGSDFRTPEDAAREPGYHAGALKHETADAYISDDRVALDIQLEGVEE